MAKRIDVSGLNAYYGAFKAIEDISMTVEPRSVTAFIGPSGCGKSTFLRTLNRMHEVTPGGRVEGKVLLDDEDLYGAGRRPGRRAPHGRHGLPAPQPLPDHVDLRQRRGRACGSTACYKKSELDDDRREVAQGRQPLERGQGPAEQARAPACPAASSSGCASPGRSRSSRRCC